MIFKKISKILLDLAMGLFIILALFPLTVGVMIFSGWHFIIAWPKEIVKIYNAWYNGEEFPDTENP